MRRRKHSGGAEAPLESKREVGEGDQRDEDHGDDGAASQFASNFRSDRLGADNPVARLRVLRVERRGHRLRDATPRTGIGRRRGAARAHCVLEVGTVLLDFRTRGGNVDRGAQLRRIGRLGELELHQGATGELDAVVHPAGDDERREADPHECDRRDGGLAPPLDEVEAGVVKDANHQMLSVWTFLERLSHSR